MCMVNVEMNRRDSAWIRLSKWWLVLLTAVMLVVAAYASRFFSRPLVAIIALILLTMGPFGHARLWLMRFLERHGYARGLPLAALVFLAAAFDAVMVSQLLTARSNLSLSWLVSDGMGWVGPVWFSAHAIIFFGLAFARPIRALRRRFSSQGESSEPSLERRGFLQGVGRASVGLPFVVSLSGVETSYDFQVEEREVVVHNWPPRLDGLRVAHLSDIHVGGAMDLEKLNQVAALTNAAKPDLVLHTGDFLTHRLPGFDEPLYEALGKVQVPHGQWACLGNHDFDNPTRLVGRLAGCGVDVLRNRLQKIDVRGERIEIGGLDFAGYSPNRSEIYVAGMSRWPDRSTVPRLLLCHDPSAFANLPDGCADLVFSGHTHGGHVGVQLSPSSAVTVVGMMGIPDQGIFERGDMKMYVTRCVGFYGYPIRLGIPPEIAVLTLRSK